MDILSPSAFVQRWSESTLSERASAQSHFIDLCQMLGEKTPVEADPAGEFYTFERGVRKSGSGGGKGFADVWYRDHFAFEYKGKHKDLDAAYDQLLRYREDLGNPPLLVVSDMERFQIHTNFTKSVKRVYEFTNDEIPNRDTLRLLRALWRDPDSLAPEKTTEAVTEEAAAGFARLADGLRSRGVEPERASHFLNKLLFCLFAEDVGLLPKDMFTILLSETARDPQLFARYAGELFLSMSTGGNFLLKDIRYFNGGLFADGDTLPLEVDELRTLASLAKLDWGSVEPAIFGTLFERSLDPSLRSKLGAHYTSKEDILTLVEPVLMAPLRREWKEVRERAAAEADRARESSGQKSKNAMKRAEGELRSFLKTLREVRVLDPACGSGNFLYVALKELLDLEKEVSTFGETLGMSGMFPEVSPEQLFGIELSPFAHELAQVVVWIGYLQWMTDNGFGTMSDPVLGQMTNITQMDAILAYDENREPVEPVWPKADFIVGNPPFLGGKRMRAELDDGYVDDLFRLYRNRVEREADLVTYWFEKARRLIARGEIRRAGLISTNSIRGGKNREVLKRIRDTGDVFFAESDRPWVQNGAAVRVSMVGFDNGSEQERILDGVPVEQINSDLTGSLDLTSAARLKENADLAFMGDTKGGPFDLGPEEANSILKAGGNPNGRPNSDVVKPWVNGLDITRRLRGFYIIDFGVEMSLDNAALYEAPFEYVNEHVRPMREKSRSTRGEWWLHERPRVDMRRALDGLERFIGTARVAKHRLFTWLETNTLPDSQVISIARDDHYFFGVLHSKAHEIWSLRMGTFLGVGNDPRYTPTTCFETFPFPWSPGEEPGPDDPLVEMISAAAARLHTFRTSWLNPDGATESELKKRTLTNLYNDRPTWLSNVHADLDSAVFAAYGWEPEISDDDILTNLLALNVERATP